MKTFMNTVLFAVLLSTTARASELPKKCETLAWSIAEISAGHLEDYSDIIDVSKGQDNTYSALVRPLETAWYQMTFKNLPSENRCQILKLEAFYR